MKKLFASAAAICLSLCAQAQFYMPGDNPGKVQWNDFSTASFHLIYPEGTDSLARRYAEALETFRIPVSRTVGYAPNQMYRRQMPVVLHAFTSSANGSVTWAPRRMDLFTVPDAYRPEPFPWIKELAIHESRHVAQMQFVKDGEFRTAGWFFGEMWGGAMCAVYCGPPFFEGDAVVAETALTGYGRGRNADFLEYMMVAFDHGDWRDWYRWRYQSIRRYTPDYYRVGYMTIAGMRTVYDDPLFTERYYSNIFRNKNWQLPLNVMGKTVKEASGKKFRDSFREIQEAFASEWKDGIEERGPFMPVDTLTARPRRFESYTGLAMAGDRLFAIRESLERGRELVETGRDGSVQTVRPFAGTTGDLIWSEKLGKLFWSETVQDKRWTLKQNSVIRSYDPATGKTSTVTREGRLFNPAAEPGGRRLSVTSYPTDGRTEVAVLDGMSGETLLVMQAPDTLQVVETAWAGNDLIVSAISETGFGLYRAGAVFEEVLAATPVAIRQLRSAEGGRIMFLSDRTGVNEVYVIDPATGATEQLTNSKYGVSDFAPADGRLCYTALAPEARYICSTAVEDLPRRDADFGIRHSYAIADRLSAQEKEIAGQDITAPAAAEMTEPEHYGKFAHLFHVHSWMPFYVDYDDVKSMSFESITTAAGPGATALFQNHLGNAYGMVGLALKKDAAGKLRNSAHIKFNYSGRYPVFEANLSVNDASASQYQLCKVYTDRKTAYARGVFKTTVPEVLGSLKVYVPMNFSSGGWQRGIIPQISYTASNTMFSKSVRHMIYLPALDDTETVLFGGYETGDNVIMQRASASFRAYCTRPVAKSGVYPRWGIGVETGITSRFGLEEVFSPAAYGYLYGYVPGIVPEHGLRLSALVQRQIGKPCFGDNYASAAPKGLAGASPALAAVYPAQSRFTADYKMAVAAVDWSGLGPVAYVRNFEITALCDMGVYFGSRHRDISSTGCLFSAGAEVAAVLGNLLWIPYDTRIGFRWTYGGGNIYDELRALDVAIGRHSIDAVFSIDF